MLVIPLLNNTTKEWLKITAAYTTLLVVWKVLDNVTKPVCKPHNDKISNLLFVAVKLLLERNKICMVRLQQYELDGNKISSQIKVDQSL